MRGDDLRKLCEMLSVAIGVIQSKTSVIGAWEQNEILSELKGKDDMNVLQEPNPSTVLSINSSKDGDLSLIHI